MQEWLQKTIVLWGVKFPFTALEFLLRFLLPVLSFILAAALLSFLIRRIGGKFIEDDGKRRTFSRRTRRILSLCAFAGILLSLGSLLGIEVYDAFGSFFRILNTPFFSNGKTEISIITLILIVPVLVSASWMGRLARRGLEAGTLKHFGLSAEQEFTVSRLIRYVVMAVMFVFGLSVIGIDLSAIGVLFGVLGIGIGFGLQSLIADLFAGLSLIGMGLIKEGDRIRVGGSDGVIQHLRLMNTELTTFENETLIIPNRHLTGGVIHSYSYKDRRIVIVNAVDVSYDSDLEEVIRILREVAERNPWLQPASEINVRIIAFGDSGISMELRTWIKDVKDKPEASSWVNLEIWRSFKAAGIEIPFPQRVIHQVSDE